jgi:hypothetical protein
VSPERSRIELLASAVAEGERVDWTAALDSAPTSNERCAIEQLRVVEGLARGQIADPRRAHGQRANGLDDEHASRRFTTTEWSLVLAAGETDSPESRKALEALCRRYWYPVYAEVRFAGYDAEGSRDLTQGFFLQLLERKSLTVADPDRGKFRGG